MRSVRAEFIYAHCIIQHCLHWTSDVCQLFIKNDCRNNGCEKQHEHYHPGYLTTSSQVPLLLFGQDHQVTRRLDFSCPNIIQCYLTLTQRTGPFFFSKERGPPCQYVIIFHFLKADISFHLSAHVKVKNHPHSRMMSHSYLMASRKFQSAPVSQTS